MSKSYRNLVFIIFTILAVILFIYFLPEITQIEWRGKNEGWSAVIRNFALILGGAFGFWFAWKRIILAERGQITDRYSKAIEQLGDRENVSVRIGGLYALQRIAKDSAEDLPTIIDVIRAFLIHPPYQKDADEFSFWHWNDRLPQIKSFTIKVENIISNEFRSKYEKEGDRGLPKEVTN